MCFVSFEFLFSFISFVIFSLSQLAIQEYPAGIVNVGYHSNLVSLKCSGNGTIILNFYEIFSFRFFLAATFYSIYTCVNWYSLSLYRNFVRFPS